MGARKLVLAAWVAGTVLAGTPSTAAADIAQVRAAAEDLSAAQFAVRDDTGVSLDALEVLQVAPGRYVGVSHAYIDGHFQARVASSTDLRSWRFEAVLGKDGGMPAIAAAPGGGYVVADEVGSTLRLLPPIALPEALTGPTRLWMLQKSQLRFRYYATLDALLAGRYTRSRTVPRRLSPTNEGTPSISVLRDGPGLAGLRVETGLHYFKDLDGNGTPDADRQATGTLRGLRTWTVRARPDLDAPFLTATAFHAPFTAAPRANVGDRDAVTLPDGTSAVIAEAQYLPQDFGAWRLFLQAAPGAPAIPLELHTPGTSRAAGNPSLTSVTLPDGRPGLVFTAFLFGEGAAPGEAGEVVHVVPLA